MPLDAATALPALRCVEIVRRMEELLARPENWCQGKAEDGPAMCLLWVLHSAATDYSDQRPIIKIFYDFMAEPIQIWNDDPARTHADVLDLLARTRRHFEEV